MKKNIKSIAILTFLIAVSYQGMAQTTGQKIGTNPTSKEASAVFELEAADKGFLMPRVALTSIIDVTTIANPANSLTVFNTATTLGSNSVTPGYYYYSKDLVTPINSKWVKVLDATTGWQLTGNKGTNPATNFLGTTDAQDLVFRTNYLERLRVTKTGRLDFSNTSGSASEFNIFIEGGNELATGGGNVAMGYSALTAVVAGIRNTAIGQESSGAISDGFGNTAIGYKSLNKLTTGSNNVGVGNQVGLNATTATANTLIGMFSGTNLTTGNINTALGYSTTFANPAGNYQLNIANNIFGTGLSGSTTTPAGLIGIGIIAPTNTLHVKSTDNPVRFEGLQPSAVATEDVVVTDATGVLKTITRASLSANSWNLLGNAGTTSATNFLGTTDAQDLVFRTNNLERLRVTKTGRLDFSNTSGSSSNTFIEGGNETTTGINNTLIGFAAANNITTGKFNIAVGSSSLNALTTGLNNIVIGVGSANSVSSANSNIVIGNNIMPSFTTGDENIFIGNNSANQATSGGQNTFLGFLSGTSFKTGFNNTMSGSGSGSSFISGNSNTFFGTGSGGNLTTGDLNIAIGRSTNLSSATGSNQLNLGNVIFGTGLTGTVVAPAGFIGIDISAPTNTLHVKATANPVRFEGLQASAVTTDLQVVVDATGVLKTIPASTNIAIITKTADYTTITTDETILVNAASGLVKITLPAASSALGKRYNVKKIDSSVNGAQVISAGGTIDGNVASTGVTGTLQWQGWVFQSDGANWYIISRI